MIGYIRDVDNSIVSVMHFDGLVDSVVPIRSIFECGSCFPHLKVECVYVCVCVCFISSCCPKNKTKLISVS